MNTRDASRDALSNAEAPDASATHASRVSRRLFLQAAGVGAAAAAAPGAAFASGAGDPFQAVRAQAGQHWDQTADIVVVGSGAAAYTAANIAHHLGNQVIMVEKATTAGGTTAKSGGGAWIPNNPFLPKLGLTDPRDWALKYMVRYSYPQLYDPSSATLGLPQNSYELMAAYYDNAAKAITELMQIGAARFADWILWNQKPAPDYFDQLPENKTPRGRLVAPVDEQGKQVGGVGLIKQLKAYADGQKIPLLLNHRAQRLVLNSQNQVVGLEATTKDGATVALRANKAVLFGSGGFTNDREMVLQFQPGPQVGGCSVPTNEGDLVRIAGAVGAKLSNMTGAFRAQVVAEQALAFSSTPSDVFFITGDSSILVNKYGVRVVDEKRNYNDRTRIHFPWDPVNAEWPNFLLFWIYDQRTADLWPGYPIPAAGVQAPYVLSAGTLADLGQAIDQRLTQLGGKIGGFRLDSSFNANLQATVGRFNLFAQRGVDEDFQRGDFAYDREWPTTPPTNQTATTATATPAATPAAGAQTWPAPGQKNVTMYPLSDKGPYYAIILGAGTLDTNGGPEINPKAQILDQQNRPIPGLYGAGNCIAAPSGTAYWGGGATIGQAIVMGYIAATNASQESPKTA